jgi:uncharacterized repeat protein (TIGR03803 family)
MFTRRTLLRGAAAALPLAFLWRRRASAAGYGPLVPDPDGLLDLPEGFSYRVIDRRGDIMSDGYRVPGAPDGMACFAGPGGTLVLMRNHELANGSGGWGPLVPELPPPVYYYDAASQGGVTRVVLDRATLAPISSNLVLYGTIKNCGGGASPWGWLTCEEDTSTGHGYVFLCSTSAEEVQPPQRVTAYGRMNHEGAVVDPSSRVAYLTEDRPDSCLYRFVPDAVDTPWQGRLQALRVVGVDRLDTGDGHAVGASWPIAWVDVTEPDPAGDSCRAEAYAAGAARFVRGEGIWMHDGSVYFTATDGGPAGAGQVFRVDPDGDGGLLTLIAQSEDVSVLDHPDAITVSPAGEVFVGEDGGGAHHLRVIGADGVVAEFARKIPVEGEMAGLCFSPDGSVLFVNLMLEGVTLAITGPFPTIDPVDDPFDPLPPPDGADSGPRGDVVGGDVVGGCSAGAGAGTGAAVALAAIASTLRRPAGTGD